MSEHVAAHVSEAQHEVWLEEADAMGASMSEYVKMMTEAGRKKFARDVEPDATRAELREQRADLQDALRDARERINQLERQLSETERRAIVEYIQKNSGTTRRDIAQHLVNTTNGRVTRLLTEMEGTELRIDEAGRYYAGDNSEGGT